jgi:superfamily II DNA or RNA helicase
LTLVDNVFLGESRLLDGPWQAFERDVARLLLANGYEDVRIVGGTGDHGADVLGVLLGELWIVQCKYTSTSPPPIKAIPEIVQAGRVYGASRLVIATSRTATDGFREELNRYSRQGIQIDLAEPNVLLGLADGTPEYPPVRRTLYAYQREAAERIRSALIDTHRAQAVLATGLGKTVIMAEVVADMLREGLIPEGRVLVMAHTKDLIDQLQRQFWFQLPKWVATHRLSDGEVPSYWDGITFATIQSTVSRLDSLPEFGLILVDEAHHIGADTFLRTFERLRPAMRAGVTATPWRGDGYDIDRILGAPVVKMGISEGLQGGFLCEVDYRLLADNVDWEFVQSASRHKYSLSQLNRKLLIPTRDEEAVRIIRDLFDREQRRSGISFSPTVVHARSFAAMLRRYGFKAESISSDLPPRERELLMSRFRSGQLDVICTVDLFNEGVDVPDVDLIVFLRATHSRRIFVQQLGRGLRINPGKDKLVVLDFVSDLRRMAEVLQLDGAVRSGSVESVSLGGRLVQFADQSAGTFMREWMLDQASLLLREEDPLLEVPNFDYPPPAPPGGVQ